MEIVKIKDQTFVIKNFMSEEECKAIVKYLDWQVEVGYIQWNQISFYGSLAIVKYLDWQVEVGYIQWNQISFYGSLAMGYWPSDNNLSAFGLYPTYFSDLKERIKNACSEALGIEMSEISFHAQKWITGAFADYHSDNSDEEGNPTAFERSKFAAFAYLNDDFEGGLLKFKDSDIVIKPEVGLLAVFAGGHENMHRVTTVESGERYTVGSFWDDAANEYTDEQRAGWEKELAAIRAEQAEIYVKWEEDAKSGNAPVLPED